MKLRLFVAVDVPEAVRDAVEVQVVEPLREVLPEARWTRPEGRHLTLCFLGWVDEGRVREVGAAVERAAASATPFVTAFEELGGFPSLSRPRVLWVGVGRGREELVGIASALAGELEPFGFPPEDRPFHPHLTLARFKRPRKVGELPVVEVPSEPFEVGSVTLFRSELHPKGARYSPVLVAPLGG